MADPNESMSSVRIELGDDSSPAPQDDSSPAPQDPGTDDIPDPASGKEGNGQLLPVLIGSVLLVVALILAVAPDSGTTAVGTPITIPTTEAPQTTLADTEVEESGDVVDDLEAGPSTSANPLDEFESAEIDFFPFDIVNADIGWFALGIGERDSFDLYRSLDGLEWAPMPAQGFPEGQVLGFAKISDQYVLAVDEKSSWSQNNADSVAAVEHRITFWESADAVDWTPSLVRGPIEGLGLPYPMQFSESAMVTPMIVPPSEGALAPLIDYLAPIMGAEEAVRVCGARSRQVDGERRFVFLDCDQNELLEIGVADAPEFFEVGQSPQNCVVQLRSSAEQEAVVRVVIEGSEDVTIDLEGRFGLFGELIGSTFLTPSNGFFGSTPECGMSGSTSGRPLSEILVWNPDTQSSIVELPNVASNNLLQSVVMTEDGDAIVAGVQSVFIAEAPFTEWSEVPILASDAPESEPFLGSISLARNGSLIMSSRGGTWSFARPDYTEWFEIEVGSRHFGQLLLVGDDFAIVQVEDATSTLVKIPLS